MDNFVSAGDILACMSELVFARDGLKNILFMNRKAEQVTGWAAGEAVKLKKCYEVFGDLEGRCKYSCPAESFPEKGPACSTFGKPIRTRDGQLLYFKASVSPLLQESLPEGRIVVLEEISGTDQCEESGHKTTGYLRKRALRESEEKYRLLLESIEDGYYEVDLAGNLIYCNDSMARIHGVKDRDSIKGINYREYMNSESAGIVYQMYNKVFSTGSPEKGFSLEIRRRDGTRRILEVSISLARDNYSRPSGFRGIVRDVTERRLAEERLKYLSMHDIMTGLYNRTYFEEEMSRLNKGRFSPVTVICFDVDGLKLVNDTFGHKRGDDLLKSVANILKEPFRASDVVARTGGDEFAVILPKTGEEAAGGLCERILEAVDRHNRTINDIPVRLSFGKATGTITEELNCHELYRRADNSMYRQKLQSKTSFRGALFDIFIKALEGRDFMAGGHAERIFDYARKLAEAIGLSGKEINDLNLLARYHDIGKVGVSESILYNPGPLNKKEMEEAKQHSEIGFRIARSIPELWSVADFILHHHEWWNGSGYPLGLAGPDIPLLCRIFSIAEAFEVMTGGRPYKASRDAGEALREINRCSGTQFDPQLTAMFTEVIKNL